MSLLSINRFSFTDTDISFRKSLITSQEMETLTLVLGGYDDSEIARKLTVSEQSIHRNISSMYFKLGVKDRLELALFAIRHGLISINYRPV